MAVRPKKHLGQHFLIDLNVVRKIADALQAPTDASVVEIGPGEGALTGLLLDRYTNMSAVEIDDEAVVYLKSKFPGLDVLHEDVLNLNWPDVREQKGEGPLFVIGNLPYYITSPILFSLLDARQSIGRAILMMQREVAKRIVAEPGSKTYGILSVQTQLLATPKILFHVSRHVFRPKPDVESSVLALDFEHGRNLTFNVKDMRRVVRTAFNQRRKMLRNSLAGVAADVGSSIPPHFAMKRPEALSPEEFVDLTNALIGKSDKKLSS